MKISRKTILLSCIALAAVILLAGTGYIMASGGRFT
jgi:hypothetical protein